MEQPAKAKLKVACITCYFDPDYVRARTIRAALGSFDDVELIVCKNMHKGLLRYPEMLIKLLQLRRQVKPDAYVLTFRGQELLPFVLAVAGRKPVVFDEFIVPLAWANQEGAAASTTVRLQRTLARVFSPLYKAWLRRCHTILADTQPHAVESARLSGVSAERYLALPVGADETMFYPGPSILERPEDGNYKVFFCGNMRPLYGLKYVLQAAVALKDLPIDFDIAGGDERAAADVETARAQGARISSYVRWLPFEEFPKAMRAANLGLTQYGDTPQARRVISGKGYQMLACATPIVLGTSEASTMFTDKQDCLLVPQADPAALAAAIRWAYEHPDETRRIGRAGRTLYEKQFSTTALTGLLRPLVGSLRAKALAGVQPQRDQEQ